MTWLSRLLRRLTKAFHCGVFAAAAALSELSWSGVSRISGVVATGTLATLTASATAGLARPWPSAYVRLACLVAVETLLDVF
jgi:hypothetical protein